MKEKIEKAVEEAKIPGSLFCGECGEELYSPMDKLSIKLYGKCPLHLEDNSTEERNLLEISKLL